MIKILILGMGSMIGHQLYNFLSNKKVKVYGTSRDNRLILKNKNIYKYDPLKNFSDIERIFKRVKPDYLINTIGVIKHRKQINNFKNTIYLNSILPHKLAKISIINKIKLIHLSTDCVFSGDKGNYSESDIPDASDLYGISKKLGEINYKDSLTLRTSFIGFEKKK
jgi:dTDP-4-dehydrorhamnose reductase